MSTVTFRGQLPMDTQQKLKLSTNKGLVGYRIKQFSIISSTPGAGNHEYIAKIRLTEDDDVGPTVNFNDPSLIAVNYLTDNSSSAGNPPGDVIIFEDEIFNQDIFIAISDATTNTIPCNYFIKLEKIKLDLNASTITTLKNLRQTQADNIDDL